MACFSSRSIYNQKARAMFGVVSTQVSVSRCQPSQNPDTVWCGCSHLSQLAYCKVFVHRFSCGSHQMDHLQSLMQSAQDMVRSIGFVLTIPRAWRRAPNPLQPENGKKLRTKIQIPQTGSGPTKRNLLLVFFRIFGFQEFVGSVPGPGLQSCAFFGLPSTGCCFTCERFLFLRVKERQRIRVGV